MRILRLLLFVLFILVLNRQGSEAQTVAGSKSNQEKSETTQSSVFFQNSTQELIVKNEVQGKYLVQVFNLTGTEVIRHDVMNASMVKIPATKLKNGVYLVRISPVPNQPSATFKIMVKE